MLDPLLLSEDLWLAEEYERAIGLEATRELMVNKGGGIIGSDIEKIAGECECKSYRLTDYKVDEWYYEQSLIFFLSNPLLPLSPSPFISLPGTAVWSLSSGVTNAVQYHIDYAELYR